MPTFKFLRSLKLLRGSPTRDRRRPTPGLAPTGRIAEAVCPRVAVEGVAASLEWDTVAIEGRVLNLSPTGAFFATHDAHELRELQAADEALELVFRFQGETFRISVSPRWHNHIESERTPAGFGLHFRTIDCRLLKVVLSLAAEAERKSA